MDLHRRQREFFGDLRVLDVHRLVQRLALDPLGHQRRGGDGGTAAVGLELGVFDDALLVDLDLQFHHVAAGRRADHAGADAVVVLVEGADVARVFVVIQNLFAVCHVFLLAYVQCAAHCTVFRSMPSLYISHSGDISRSLPIFSCSSLMV